MPVPQSSSISLAGYLAVLWYAPVGTAAGVVAIISNGRFADLGEPTGLEVPRAEGSVFIRCKWANAMHATKRASMLAGATFCRAG